MPPSLEAERLIYLLGKLYEYRLVIDILFGISAEVSCQRSFRTIRTCTLFCCFCLLLLSFLHQRSRRCFVLSICSISCCCCSINCFFLRISAYEVYSSTDAQRLVRSTLRCCVLLYERAMYVMCCCARWRMEMLFPPLFPASFFFFTQNRS